MTEFEEIVTKYYVEKGYNCAESMMRAANDYYQLGLHHEDMKMAAGLGSGLFVGSTCGALVSSVMILSKMIIEEKAHDQMKEIRTLEQACVRNFKEAEGGMTCVELKPKHFSPEQKCYKTVMIAANALEKTVNEQLGGKENVCSK